MPIVRLSDTYPFVSAAGRQEALDDHARHIAALPMAVESRRVPTRFGEAHLLIAGNPEAPPLLTLHGLNVGAPRHLAMFAPLSRHFRIYAPDTPGQIGQSAPAAMKWRSGDYGAWVNDVLDNLGIDQVPALAMSYGGAILLQAAIAQPHRVTRAALVVPAGITTVNLPGTALRLVLPAVLYRLLGWPSLLRAQVGALSDDLRSDLLDLFDLAARTLLPTRALPPAHPAAALRRFTAPVLVIAARRDTFFPLARLSHSARQALPGLTDVRVLAERHIPDLHEQAHINDHVLSFLTA